MSWTTDENNNTTFNGEDEGGNTMSEQSVPLDANCMVCGLYKPCTRCTDIGWVCLNCQSSAGAKPASEPPQFKGYVSFGCGKHPRNSQGGTTYKLDCLDCQASPQVAWFAGEPPAPSAPEPTPEQIAEKWATHPKLVVQCNLCNKDYAPAIAFEKCINTARFTPHPWKEKTILLPRKEAITAAIREALASSSVREREADEWRRLVSDFEHHVRETWDATETFAAQGRLFDYLKNKPVRNFAAEAASARLELAREGLRNIGQYIVDLYIDLYKDNPSHWGANRVKLIGTKANALLVQLKKDGGE